MFVRATLIVALWAFTALATPAYAKTDKSQKFLGSFGHWTAYSFHEKDQPVCYMSLSIPLPKTKKGPAGEERLTITQRPADGSKDVVSYTAGYVFKSGTNVLAHTGKSSFDLFTVKNTAWARDATTDRLLTNAIKASKTLTLSGQPAKRGAPTIKRTLDLTGAPAAYHAMNKACGLETDAPPPSNPKKKAKKTAPKAHKG